MEDIRFYNFEYELLHVEPRYMSSSWEIYYNDIGTFEAHFPLSGPVVDFVMANPYLVAVQGDKTAILTAKQLSDELAVFGRTCNFLLSKRVVAGFAATNSPAETLVRGKVSSAFADVSSFQLGAVSGLTIPVSYKSSKYESLFDVTRDCLSLANGGHELVFDPVQKKWIFRILKGENLDLVISEANRNAYNTQYDTDFLDYFSEGYYLKESESETETETEQWIHLVKESGKTGMYRWAGVLTGTSAEAASLELAKQKVNTEIRMETSSLKHGRDYQLGDIVNLQIEKGSFKAVEQKRITGVQIWYETNDMGECPIFEEDENNGI